MLILGQKHKHLDTVLHAEALLPVVVFAPVQQNLSGLVTGAENRDDQRSEGRSKLYEEPLFPVDYVAPCGLKW